MDQATQTRGKTKYRGITKFSQEKGIDRTWIWERLERKDPDMMEAFNAFLKQEKETKAARIAAAEKELKRLQAQ